MEKKETAIKWFAEKTLILQIELRLKIISIFEFENKYEQYIKEAKAMEKQQIMDAYLEGESDAEHLDNSAENYYNETYLKQNNNGI